MPRLAEFQADFRAYLLASGADREAAGLDRRRVHRNNCFHALTDSLAALYPVVQRLVGVEFFAPMARAYIDGNPPVSPALLDYGAGFADFLSGFPPVKALPYLADVAHLEWCRHEVYHGPDAEPLPLEQLTAIPPAQLPNLELRFHPAHRFLESSFPVDEIWRVNQAEDAVDRRITLGPAECRLLIIRPRWDVRLLALDAAAMTFAKALAGGMSLGRAHEQGAARDQAFDVETALRRLAAAECFADLPAAR